MTDTRDAAARARLVSALSALAAAALLVSGCGAESTPDASTAGDPTTSRSRVMSGPTAISTPPTTISGKPAQTMTVQQLAAALGCQANLAGKRADYRQATCTVDGAEIVLLDFDTTEGQRAWLDTATMYGGTYLVGDRWALSGKSKEYMQSLQATLGGTIDDHGAYGSTPGPR